MLHKQVEESSHVGQPIGSYLENGEPKVLEDFDEEGMQRELHSELEVALRQSNITIWRSMWPLRIIWLDHLAPYSRDIRVQSSGAIKDWRSPQLTAISSTSSSL